MFFNVAVTLNGRERTENLV
jgi:hypothetical protein